MAEVIKAAYLKGLTFTTSEPRKAKGEDGREGIKHVPVERALKPEDVLDWKDCGDRVVMVTADGQKTTVLKKDDPKKDEK